MNGPRFYSGAGKVLPLMEWVTAELSRTGGGALPKSLPPLAQLNDDDIDLYKEQVTSCVFKGTSGMALRIRVERASACKKCKVMGKLNPHGSLADYGVRKAAERI